MFNESFTIYQNLSDKPYQLYVCVFRLIVKIQRNYRIQELCGVIENENHLIFNIFQLYTKINTVVLIKKGKRNRIVSFFLR